MTDNVLGRSLARRRERTLTSAQLGLEHGVQGLYPAKVSHQEDVLRVRLAPDGLQRLHVHAAHADGEDLNARPPGLGRHLLHGVLGPPVRHHHGDAWDEEGGRPRPLLLGEHRVHGVLQGQARHGARGQVLHTPHRPLHLGPGGMGIEGELALHHAAVLQQGHARGVGPHLQELQQVQDEGLDLLVVPGPDAAGAVDDKGEVQGDAPAGGLCGKTQGGFGGSSDQTMWSWQHKVACQELTNDAIENLRAYDFNTEKHTTVLSFHLMGVLAQTQAHKRRHTHTHTHPTTFDHPPAELLGAEVRFGAPAEMALGSRLSSRAASQQHSRHSTPRTWELILTTDSWGYTDTIQRRGWIITPRGPAGHPPVAITPEDTNGQP